MGLFDNIRADIMEEFNSYCSSNISTQEIFSGDKLQYILKGKYIEGINNRANELFGALEFKRWEHQITCPYCSHDKCYELADFKWYRCGNYECKKDFNVFTNTILSNTKLELNKWYDAIKMYRNDPDISLKKGSLSLNITMKTLWWMKTKLNSSALFLEEDAPILLVLLSPLSITTKNYISSTLSPKQKAQESIRKIIDIYGDDFRKEILITLYRIRETANSS